MGQSIDLKRMQSEIQKEGLDGWLFYDFRGTDPLGLKILKFSSEMLKTRRWYYLIPAKGEPKKLCHKIETGSLDHLPGNNKVLYLSWKELEIKLKEMLSNCKKIAMQYSPNNIIPYVSKVDAGTYNLISSYGIEIVSSANLVQSFEACMTSDEIKSHLEAGKSIRDIIDRAFKEIGDSLSSGRGTDEYAIQQFICAEFEKEGMQLEEEPIVAVNGHAGNPHYGPTKEKHSRIEKNNLVLLDVFARKKGEQSIWADYTWMGYTGSDIPEKIVKVFNIVRDARDKAYNFIKNSLKARKEIYGWQVDDAARNHISENGYGDYFIHRTGHSIGRILHGNGVNIDNLETKDERKIVDGLCFSIEPGIYLKDFGIRSEIDVYIEGNEAKISGLPVQEEIVKIIR